VAETRTSQHTLLRAEGASALGDDPRTDLLAVLGIEVRFRVPGRTAIDMHKVRSGGSRKGAT
jgi:hypothetical protein